MFNESPQSASDDGSANIAFSPDTRNIVARDHLSLSDFSLYQFPDMKMIQSFTIGKTNQTCYCPNQSTFAESGSMVVTGSDHGQVYIFDANTGRLTEVLSHGELPVQSVAAFSYADRNVIVSGSADICLYVRQAVRLLPIPFSFSQNVLTTYS